MLYHCARERLQQDRWHIVEAEDECHECRAVRDFIHQPRDGDAVDRISEAVDHVCGDQFEIFFLRSERAVAGDFAFHFCFSFVWIVFCSRSNRSY
ncbi:hypothetical protein SDC9_210959 [bioreactor metagenome]|uniref:Uncharacterized protein n=1 Tax=bioreactor metagenome TaxID=1076179 RepID=A0A645JT41_9ZZZZ